MAARIIPDVVREHVELAAFQWAQRDTLAHADPPAAPEVIAGIDARLEANLDAIRIAGAAAWPFVIEAFESYPEKGELFVAGFLALETGDEKRLEQAVNFARGQADRGRGLVGAFRWLPPDRNAARVRAWLDDPDAMKRALAVGVLAEFGADGRDRLDRLLADPDPHVRAESCRLAGLVGRRDLAERLRALMRDEAEEVRFQATRAGARLGLPEAVDELKAVAVGDAPQALVALRAVVEAGPPEAARAWLGALFRDEATRARAVRGAGMLGDRTVLRGSSGRCGCRSWPRRRGRAFSSSFPRRRGTASSSRRTGMRSGRRSRTRLLAYPWPIASMRGPRSARRQSSACVPPPATLSTWNAPHEVPQGLAVYMQIQESISCLGRSGLSQHRHSQDCRASSERCRSSVSSAPNHS